MALCAFGGGIGIGWFLGFEVARRHYDTADRAKQVAELERRILKASKSGKKAIRQQQKRIR